MNANQILLVNKEHLLLMQVLCWLGPGIKILITGVQALLQVHATTPQRIWWLCLIAVLVAVLFSLMFNNFVRRYTAVFLISRNVRNRFSHSLMHTATFSSSV